MLARKIGLGVAALALPMTALAAAPAQAATVANQDSDRIWVQIRDVSVHRHHVEVKVRYFCDGDDDADLRVTLRQDDARYSGREKDLECDGRDTVTVKLDRDRGRLEDGRADVKAVLRVDRDRAVDNDRVRIDVRDRH